MKRTVRASRYPEDYATYVDIDEVADNLSAKMKRLVAYMEGLDKDTFKELGLSPVYNELLDSIYDLNHRR